MSNHEQAIAEYAEFFVQQAISENTAEQVAKALAENPQCVEQFRERWIAKAESLVNSILSKDKVFVERAMSGLLHPDNKASRRLFTAVTGLNLSATVKGTWSVVMEYCGDEIRAVESEVRAKREAEEAARLAAIKERADLAMDKAEQAILNGEQVGGDMVVDLCKRHGVAVPPQTTGCLRKRISTLRFDGATQSVMATVGRSRNGSATLPQGVVDVFRSLVATLQGKAVSTP